MCVFMLKVVLFCPFVAVSTTRAADTGGRTVALAVLMPYTSISSPTLKHSSVLFIMRTEMGVIKVKRV